MLVKPVASVVTVEVQFPTVVKDDPISKMFSLASPNVSEQKNDQSSLLKVPQADITANPYLHKGSNVG